MMIGYVVSTFFSTLSKILEFYFSSPLIKTWFELGCLERDLKIMRSELFLLIFLKANLQSMISWCVPWNDVLSIVRTSHQNCAEFCCLKGMTL